jgi:hypothetical protein
MRDTPPPPAAPAKWFLSVFTLLLGWGVLELGVRLLFPALGAIPPPVPEQNRLPWIAYDSRIGWVNKAGFEGRQVKSNQFDVAITIDGRGCRRARASAASAPRRILVVGDSFTFGHGVNDDEAFAALLEKRAGAPAVMNAGCVGTGHDQHYLLYKQWLADAGKPRPDLVIWGFSSADIPRNTVAFRRLVDPETGLDYGKPRFVLSGGKLVLTHVPTPEPGQVEASLQAWAGAREYERNAAARFLRRSRAIRVAWDVAADKLEQLPLASAIAGEFVEDCRKEQVPLIIVNLPTRRWLNTSNPVNRVKQWMNDALLHQLVSKHNAVVVDCTEAFLAQPDLDALFIADGHYSPAGQAVVAEALSSLITTEKL